MNRDALVSQLLSDEGLRLKPYRCTAGKLSIGVGRNLDDNGITQAEALMLLNNDINTIYSLLSAALPWLCKLNDARQNVLVNMAFNMGVDGLMGFKFTLDCVQRGDYAEAAKAMLNSKWARQVGNRAIRLAKIMEAGEL